MAISHIDILHCIASKLDARTLLRFHAVNRDALLAARQRYRELLAEKRNARWNLWKESVLFTENFGSTNPVCFRIESGIKVYGWAMKFDRDDYRIEVKRVYGATHMPYRFVLWQKTRTGKKLAEFEAENVADIIKQVETGITVIPPKCRKARVWSKIEFIDTVLGNNLYENDEIVFESYHKRLNLDLVERKPDAATKAMFRKMKAENFRYVDHIPGFPIKTVKN